MKQINFSINTKHINSLIELLKLKNMNEKLCKEHTRSFAMKGIFIHFKLMGEKSNPKNFALEMDKAIQDDKAKSIYRLPKIKENLQDLELMVKNIENELDSIKDEVMMDLSEYVNMDSIGNINTTLYAVGYSHGFCLIPKHIYMNIGHYIGKFDSFVTTFSHEVYHARKRSLFKYGKFALKKRFSKDKYFHIIFGEIIEEGIAVLVEMGTEFKAYDNSCVNESELMKTDKHFKLVNDTFGNIENDNGIKGKKEEFLTYEMKKHNFCYTLGYVIAKQVYEYSGMEGLNTWSVDHSCKEFMKTYMIACAANRIETGLSSFIEDLIMSE